MTEAYTRILELEKLCESAKPYATERVKSYGF